MSTTSSDDLPFPPDTNPSVVVEKLILDLVGGVREKRLRALHNLCKMQKDKMVQNLGPLLWYTHGVISALLEEIMSIYPALSPSKLMFHRPWLHPVRLNTLPENEPPLGFCEVDTNDSGRVCDAMVLLQCVASHSDTRVHFLNAHIPLYLYPFLNTTKNTKTFDYLRLTSLGVIGALVKADDNDVISFLLSTEIVPLCLRSMELGTELTKTVAAFIIQRILMDDTGLRYVCTTPMRVVAISQVFANMVNSVTEKSTPCFLKHIVLCYATLSENDRACKILLKHLPDSLMDGTFHCLLREDMATIRLLQEVLYKITTTGMQSSSFPAKQND